MASDLTIQTTRTFDELRKYLNFIANVQKSTKPDWRYASYEELVMTLGEEFTLDPRVKPKVGQSKECFKNAIERLLIESDEQEWYCEGWAVTEKSVIPIHHAWTVNSRGYAVDPTWETERAFFIGVPMEFDYCMSLMLRTGYYGVFGSDWQNDFSILKEGLPENALPGRRDNGESVTVRI